MLDSLLIGRFLGLPSLDEQVTPLRHEEQWEMLWFVRSRSAIARRGGKYIEDCLGARHEVKRCMIVQFVAAST
jgi:hypothetical protein